MDTNHIFPPDYDRDRIGRSYAEFAERYGYEALVESLAGATIDFMVTFWPDAIGEQDVEVIVRAADRATVRALSPAELAVLCQRARGRMDTNMDTMHLVARGIERCLTEGAMS